MQGEIGASSVEGRDMKMKLKFANTANGLLAVIFRKLTSEARRKIWVRQLREYLGELGLDFADVGRMDTDDIGREVNKWENNRWRYWRRDIESKATLEPGGIRETLGMRVYTAMNMVQSCCFNVEQIPTLKLRWRQGFEGGAVDCLLCGVGGRDPETLCCGVPLATGDKKTIWCIWNQSTGGGSNVYGEE